MAVRWNVARPQPAGEDERSSSARPAFGAAHAGSHLTSLERSVLALSLGDPPSALVQPTSLAWIIGRVTGCLPPNGLANPRLERLRCYCIALRVHGVNAPETRQYDLLDVFSEKAIVEMIERISVLSTNSQSPVFRVSAHDPKYYPT